VCRRQQQGWCQRHNCSQFLLSFTVCTNKAMTLLMCMQDTYGPPLGKKLLMFLDDVNMPRVDTYGTQQPIALLKLFVERKGFYDRGKELSWKNVKDVQMVGAMGPPGGARNNVDPRFISLFSVFEIQAPSNSNLRTIYQVC
jgi:dynein heavy chain